MTVIADDPRYPIGRFEPPEVCTAETVREWIDDIERLPGDLRDLVTAFTEQLLDTPYRPGGWTARQVIHHLPDSHLNSYVRFKWALTEEQPTIKPYDQERWAELADSRVTPIGVSLDLLDALHRRWVILLRALDAADLDRRFVHPETGTQTVAVTIGLYAWHGRHHLAHLQRVGGLGGQSVSPPA